MLESGPMKALETAYAGVLFRSRIEARWAVYFDATGEPWEYEKQGYELPSGWYLPDFWLPRLNLWWEVKGAAPTDEEERLAVELVSEGTGAYGTVLSFGDIPRRPDEEDSEHRGFKLYGLSSWSGLIGLAAGGEWAVSYGIERARSARFERGMETPVYDPAVLGSPLDTAYKRSAIQPILRALGLVKVGFGFTSEIDTSKFEGVKPGENAWIDLVYVSDRDLFRKIAECPGLTRLNEDELGDVVYRAVVYFSKWVRSGHTDEDEFLGLLHRALAQAGVERDPSWTVEQVRARTS